MIDWVFTTVTFKLNPQSHSPLFMRHEIFWAQNDTFILNKFCI